MKKFLYFAYGSNMLFERIKARCNSAKMLDRAVLIGYSLCFHKRSIDGSGKATIVKSKDNKDHVYGIIFEIAISDQPELDKFEGYGRGYNRADSIEVKTIPDGRQRYVTTYIADQKYIDNTLKPYDWYKALVLAGAVQNHLETSYTDSIRSVSDTSDSSVKRLTRLEALDVLRDAGFPDYRALSIKDKQKMDEQNDQKSSRIKRLKGSDLTKYLSAIVALIPLIITVASYLHTRKLEVQRPILESQFKLYQEVVDVSSRLSTVECSPADIPCETNYKGDCQAFRGLYWGRLAVVENRQVEQAMIKFLEVLKQEKSICFPDDGNRISKHDLGDNNLSLKQASLDLAHCVNESLQLSWDVELLPFRCKYPADPSWIRQIFTPNKNTKNLNN